MGGRIVRFGADRYENIAMYGAFGRDGEERYNSNLSDLLGVMRSRKGTKLHKYTRRHAMR
jgi:hypothetical protein